MTTRIVSVAIKAEFDVVASRQRARQIAALCGFTAQDQVRIATAVSELARNAFQYASGGKVDFLIDADPSPQVLLINVSDDGPGIRNLAQIVEGAYRSTTGMGLGILGAHRLMDQCDITTSAAHGTRIALKKFLPREARRLSAGDVGEMGSQLIALPSDVALSEVQQQNQELLVTLSELKTRQDELLRLTRELEDTNRGVVALYAELDQKAEALRRADRTKSRFLASVSHELRTPLSSIRALSKLLLDRADGELSIEQEKQVGYIRTGAESLAVLVNDLLDLAKIEAGKVDVTPVQFQVGDMFSSLRGMMRPLLLSDAVSLVFETETGLGPMLTDEPKLSQILRNFISNALKYTQEGQVTVSAALLADQATVRFSVSDTGLGIAPEHQESIFEEFSQIENRLQHRSKGTGLGLPLCRKLAALLGGDVGVQSAAGKGSTFWATIPRTFVSVQRHEV
ncbi:MAG: ATP-binding protein [Pseudomonadota bacterium]|nr:ATP-binding protein [Pseudomonadota bacterium]